MKKSDRKLVKLAKQMEIVARRSDILDKIYGDNCVLAHVKMMKSRLRKEYNSLWDRIMEGKPKGLAGVLAQILCLSRYHNGDEKTASAFASAIPIIKRAAHF